MPTRKWRNEKLVNTSLTGNQVNSSVTALAGGGYVVVWQDDATADSAIRGQRYDAVGNKLGAEIAIAVAVGNDRTLPSVTGLADGGFYVTFTQDAGNAVDNFILGSVYDANGAFVRSQPVVFAFGLDTDASTVRLGTGSIVAWEDPDATFGDIVFRIFDAAGNGTGLLTANTTTASTQLDPSLAAAPDASRFAVVWGSNDAGLGFTVRGRIFNSNGTENAPEFVVGDAGSLVTGEPVVAWLSNQRFVVAWNDGLGGPTKAKIFGFNNGAGGVVFAVTGEILVNATGSSAFEPQIAVLPSGGFVVSWTDGSGVGGDTTGFAIKLQTFDAGGTKIGGEFLVNTTTSLDQERPSISALADGRVVVTWTDESSGNGDIRMQIVDPRDGIVTGTANAETLYGHDAVGDEINGLNGNDICWGLNGNDSLLGGEGADFLIGGIGDDALFGGAGNDLLRGDAGADELDGEAGFDTASYVGALVSVVVALDGSLVATNEAAGDTFLGIENLIGANRAGAGDTLRGDAGANTIQGLDGNDTLQGLVGNDTLIGGLGADSLSGATGDDRHFYNFATEGGDTISGFSSAAAGNNDSFWFKGTAFAGLPIGALAAAAFQSSVSNVAANPNVRFFYETDTGILRFDADGSGAGAAVVIATLTGLPAVALSDFMIF